MSKKKIVVLLGAHRSGTSLAANILNQLGLPLGDELLPGHADNPEGFFEHRGILAETKSIEEKLGLNPFSGSNMLPPAEDWWNSKILTENIKALGQILQGELKDRDIFGFKDPRTLLLLPLWQKIIKEQGWKPVYIFLIRHPEVVAKSIAKRQGLQSIHGEYIWTAHWSYAISHLTHPPHGVVNYENWFDNSKKQIKTVLELLGDQGVPSEHALKIMKTIVKPDLRHQKKTAAYGKMMAETTALYDQISIDPAEADWSQARKAAADFLTRISMFAPVYESVAERAQKVGKQLRSCETRLADLKNKTRQVLQRESADTKLQIKTNEIVDVRQIDFPDLNCFINATSGPGKKLKVCIATEDIVGPVRNGGIGTTYTHLAKLLAKAGHDTCILYLRSEYCENKTIPYWVNYYQQFGVKFIPLDTRQYPIQSNAPRWFQPMFAMYEYLKKEHFDLVHVSEWHGSGYLSLTAKKMGLAFKNTLFCVKTSSPWLWNREYGLHTIQDISDLPKIYAEQLSVELGDVVIGGSKDLLCWMMEHGYTLPKEHVYVQPNVMVPLDFDDLAEKRRKRYGKRIEIQEIVFFGRLEYRKGLDIFFDALEMLISKGAKIPKIYLMGKYGERIPTYPELSIPEYISARSKKWPVTIEILDNYDNEKAIRFLLSGKRLAVMPSIIENSSLAVYETAYYGIPFVASNSGGTPELVLEKDRVEVLTDAHPVPLAKKIKQALDQGGFIARPSFKNERNLAVWLRFHSAAGTCISSWHAAAKTQESAAKTGISVCLVVSDDHEYASAVIEQIEHKLEAHDAEIIVVNNGSSRKETLAWLDEMAGLSHPRQIFETMEGWGEQYAQNYAASRASKDILVFPRLGAIPKDNYLEMITTAAAHGDADVLCCFYEEISYENFNKKNGGMLRCAVMPEDASYGFYNTENVSPVIAVKKSTFNEVGGFDTLYKVPGATLELLSKILLTQKKVMTIPEVIVTYIKDFPDSSRSNQKALPYRSIRPHLKFLPPDYSRMLMTARGIFATLQNGNASKAESVSFLSGNTGLSSNNFNSEDLSFKIGHYPKLRNLGLWFYHFQIRMMRRLIRFEVNCLSRLLSLRNFLRK